MTSRQRLMGVLNGESVDRVPISTYELVGYNSHAWENQEPSYRALMDAIRRHTDCVAMWNPPSDERFLGSAYPVEIESHEEREGPVTTVHRTMHTPKGDLTQTLQVVDGVHTVWQIEHWCKSIEDVERALSVPYVPVTYTRGDYDRIRAEVSDRGILMASTGDALIHAAELMEMGEYTVWAMTETEHFEQTLAILHERNQQTIQSLLEAVPIELYRICGPEYATPPYLPNSYFQRFVVPQVRDQVDLIHRYGRKARFHCHGRIREALDGILSTGADAIDPCEGPPSGDIELSEVKRKVGDRMCIFGNLQLWLLESCSEQQVRDEVRRCMDAAKEGGRYVIMPTAAPINVPLSPQTERNYISFIEAALEFGRY